MGELDGVFPSLPRICLYVEIDWKKGKQKRIGDQLNGSWVTRGLDLYVDGCGWELWRESGINNPINLIFSPFSVLHPKLHLILLTNYMYFTTYFPFRPFHNFPSLILSFHFANFLFWFSLFFLFHMRRLNLQTQRLTVEHKKVCKESITRFPFRRGFAFDFALVNIALVAHGPATTERGNGGGASKYICTMWSVWGWESQYFLHHDDA